MDGESEIETSILLGTVDCIKS